MPIIPHDIFPTSPGLYIWTCPAFHLCYQFAFRTRLLQDAFGYTLPFLPHLPSAGWAIWSQSILLLHYYQGEPTAVAVTACGLGCLLHETCSYLRAGMGTWRYSPPQLTAQPMACSSWQIFRVEEWINNSRQKRNLWISVNCRSLQKGLYGGGGGCAVLLACFPANNFGNIYYTNHKVQDELPGSWHTGIKSTPSLPSSFLPCFCHLEVTVHRPCVQQVTRDTEVKPGGASALWSI